MKLWRVTAGSRAGKIRTLNLDRLVSVNYDSPAVKIAEVTFCDVNGEYIKFTRYDFERVAKSFQENTNGN